MISRLELKELASHRLDDAYFVSLFLNVDPKQVKKEEWQLQFKNLARGALAAMPNGDKARVHNDISRVEKFLGDHPNDLKRGLAVISSSAKDFWWVYNSALPFMADLVIKHDPYIKPLAHQLDQYQRYLIAWVGGDEARLFIAGMGELFEITDIYHPVSTDNALRDGGRGDFGALRAQSRKEHTRQILFKDAALVLERLLAKEEIKRVLLAGVDSARGHFKEALPETLRHKIVAETHIDMKAGEKELLAHCLPMMKEVEHNFERKALAEIFDKAGKPGGGIFGLADVLTALQSGNVQKMYVMTHLKGEGMSCPQCGALTPKNGDLCSYCSSKMEVVPFIYDHAIQKAIDKGIRVDLVEESPQLAAVGGIGALLRY